MTWIDTADDAIAAARQRSDAGLRVFTREAWAALSEEQRGAMSTAGMSATILGVRFRHSKAPWLVVARENLSSDKERWILWDMRTRPPSPLVAGIPRLDLAQKVGNVAAHSRVMRFALGASMVGMATLAALASAWRRERA